jgi:D-glycero-D-manno-heptose 1,7-bisphosphate phosphatase
VSGGTPAVFLDRDGTIIEDVHYVGNPQQVRLLSGVAAAIRRLNEARIPVVVVTNQSGIARGRFTLADYERVRARTDELLAAGKATIDASYMCPHHPDFTGPCDCRKPGTLLFSRAADDLGLDLARSWFVGDKLSDVRPAQTLGGTGILVASTDTSEHDIRVARQDFSVAASLDEAVSRIIESAR